jgi:hypothetical protein
LSQAWFGAGVALVLEPYHFSCEPPFVEWLSPHSSERILDLSHPPSSPPPESM